MNAPRPLFLKACRPGRFAAAAAGCALLAGCVANPFAEAQVDAGSPVAAEVARLARAERDYPSFSEIPPLPQDMRPVRAFGQAAEELKLARAQLERETAPETWTLHDTESFAARARRAAGPELEPVSPTDPEAFARELRERATPPPRR